MCVLLFNVASFPQGSELVTAYIVLFHLQVIFGCFCHALSRLRYVKLLRHCEKINTEGPT